MVMNKQEARTNEKKFVSVRVQFVFDERFQHFRASANVYEDEYEPNNLC